MLLGLKKTMIELLRKWSNEEFSLFRVSALMLPAIDGLLGSGLLLLLAFLFRTPEKMRKDRGDKLTCWD